MKPLLISTALIVLGPSAFSAITYESFDYAAATTLESSADWAPLNTGTAPTITTGNLSVPGMVDPAGNMVSFPGGNFQEAIGTLDSYSSGTVFFSLAFQLSSLPTAATYSFALATGNTNYGAPIYLQASGAGFQVGLANRSSGATIAYAPTLYDLNSTVFIVGSYTFNAGATNDVSNLWINPDASTFNTGSTPTATLTATGGTDRTIINQFLLRGAAGSPAGVFDELRIGTTWASVAVPEPATALLGAFGLLGLLRRRR